MTQTEFTQLIRQALEHLHDFAYLQTLSLTQALSQGGQTLDQSVRRLRSALLEAIEQLKPDGPVSPFAKEQRPYVLLYGRYVQGLETHELLEELAISLRQLRREQKRALQAVSDLLWDRWAEELSPELSLAEARQAMAEAEAAQLINQAQLEDFDLTVVIGGVLAILAPVAENNLTEIINQWPSQLPPVRANRMILRQALLGLLSYALDQAVGGKIWITGEGQGEISLQIKSRGSVHSQKRTGVGLNISEQLISSLGGRIEFMETSPSHHTLPSQKTSSSPNQTVDWQVTLYLPQAQDIPILVVDDNVGLINLFRRYLAGQRYRVLEAHTSTEIAELIQQTRPNLIVLDVMMPEQDGWEVLQDLQANAETRDIPILICSVLNEPKIALALGASDYLLKPVTQDALLSKVEQWCHQIPPLAEL